MRISFTRIIQILTILILLGAGVLYSSHPIKPNDFQSFPQIQQEQVSRPIVFKIPKLGIETNIEEVGLDKEGRMDVPKLTSEVGWFMLGYRPGEKGNAVINGHLDSATGSAVFYKLDTLNIGDSIIIVDAQQRSYEFKVTDIKIYPYDQVPLSEIFSEDSIPKLNLITCDGIFDTGNKNYSERLVVYSKLTTSLQ